MSRIAGSILLLATIGTIPVPAQSGWSPVTLEDPTTGSSVTLEAGAPALHVVLFATWCPACVDELGELAELDSRWAPDGYRLVLVAVATRHTPEKLARFVQQRTPPGKLLFDTRGDVERALGSPGLPTHVLFDGRGRELLRADALGRDFEQKVEQLVRQRRGRSGG